MQWSDGTTIPSRGLGLRPIAQSVPALPKARGLPVSVPVAYLAHMLQGTFPAGFIAPCGCIPQSLWWRMLDLSGKPDTPAVKREAEDWGK
jgi:hypothetical protein